VPRGGGAGPSRRMAVQRYKITVAYRGTRYHGWQQQPALATYKGERQPGMGVAPAPSGQREGEEPAPQIEPQTDDISSDAAAAVASSATSSIPTIQGELIKTIGEVVGHPVEVVGSSRTDAGVHAKGQVAHFDTDKVQIPREGLRRAVNHRLPSDILIRTIDPVPDTFDAIASTRTKRYQYLIWNHTDRPPFFSDLAWHRWHYLDVPKITRAARHFVGEHDFASFARPGHGRDHTMRTMFACDVSFRSPKLVIAIEGSGFLWNMVRIMVGTLVQVGLGRIEPDAIPEVLAARDRQAAGPTAPPHGLYLQWVRTGREAGEQRGDRPRLSDETPDLPGVEV
jgi:tRNA pseudouridine38-40 synthase